MTNRVTFNMAGKEFDTQAEAQAYGRYLDAVEHIASIDGGNEEVGTWVVDEKENILSAYNASKSTRLSAEEIAEFANALKILASSEDPQFSLFKKYSGRIVVNKIPVPREKSSQAPLIMEAMMSITDGNEKLSNWLVEHETSIKEGFALLSAHSRKKATEKEAEEAKAAA
jgi:hypothetical protein